MRSAISSYISIAICAKKRAQNLADLEKFFEISAFGVWLAAGGVVCEAWVHRQAFGQLDRGDDSLFVSFCFVADCPWREQNRFDAVGMQLSVQFVLPFGFKNDAMLGLSRGKIGGVRGVDVFGFIDGSATADEKIGG